MCKCLQVVYSIVVNFTLLPLLFFIIIIFFFFKLIFMYLLYNIFIYIVLL